MNTTSTENYQPTEEDVAWTQKLVELSAEGGFWGWPGTGAVYKILKSRKTFVEVHVNDTKHRARMAAVAKRMGWRVIELKSDE